MSVSLLAGVTRCFGRGAAVFLVLLVAVVNQCLNS